MKDAITRIRMELPRTINEPSISRIDVTTMPIVTYAVSAPQMTLEELSWFIDDKIGREVQSVRGVAQIGASAAWTARSACRSTRSACWRLASRRAT